MHNLNTIFDMPIYISPYVPKQIRKEPPTLLNQQTGNILFRMFCHAPPMRTIEYDRVESDSIFIINTNFMQGIIIPEKGRSIISDCIS